MAPQFTLKNVMPPPLNCSKKLSTTVKYSQIFRAPPPPTINNDRPLPFLQICRHYAYEITRDEVTI